MPLNELTQENLRDLAQKTPIERLAKGKALFRKGDEDNYSYYLLSGEVVLVGGDEKKPTRIVGGTALLLNTLKKLERAMSLVQSAAGSSVTG